MTRNSLKLILEDFASTVQEPATALASLFILENPVRTSPSVRQQSALDRAVEDARKEGFTAGYDSARRDHEARLEEAVDAHTQALERERCRWVADQSSLLAKSLEGAISELEVRLSDALAHVLRPVVARSLRRDALQDIANALRLKAGNSPTVTAVASGPEDLLDALTEQLAGSGVFLAREHLAEPRIKLRLDDTVIIADFARIASLLVEDAP